MLQQPYWRTLLQRFLHYLKERWQPIFLFLVLQGQQLLLLLLILVLLYNLERLQFDQLGSQLIRFLKLNYFGELQIQWLLQFSCQCFDLLFLG